MKIFYFELSVQFWKRNEVCHKAASMCHSAQQWAACVCVTLTSPPVCCLWNSGQWTHPSSSCRSARSTRVPGRLQGQIIHISLILIRKNAFCVYNKAWNLHAFSTLVNEIRAIFSFLIVWSKIELQKACVKLIHMRLKAIYIFYVRD